jgi:hypothetical protein
MAGQSYPRREGSWGICEPGDWLRQPAAWAGSVRTGWDTLNLYDVSAVAHAELIRAGRELAVPVGEPQRLAGLRAQLARGMKRAHEDPFGAGMVYDDFDAASHGFGLVATAALYGRLTGDTRYDRSARRSATGCWAPTRGASRS